MPQTEETAKAIVMHLTGRPDDPTPTLLRILDDFRNEESLRVAASDDLFRHAIKIRNEALRKIAFWIPTIAIEQDYERYVNVEEVFALKRIAADVRFGVTEEK